ncbi:adenylate kinase [Mycobacteroides abscessus subsp. abscessus]|nr:adenylate kinase [Mycobacteroides abscessus subsp. abscessus]
MPSEVTNKMVEARLDEPDAAAGFILDGFPRTVDQADALAAMEEARGVTIDAVLEFRVPVEELVQRLLGRGRADDTEDIIRNRLNVYRDETAPLLEYYQNVLQTIDAVLEFRVPVEELVQRLLGRGRADDTEDIIRNRLNVYRDETAPLLEYYQNVLQTIDAVGTVDEVFARTSQALGR